MAKGKEKEEDYGWPDLEDIEIEVIEFDSVEIEANETSGGVKITPSEGYTVVDTFKIKDRS